MTGLAANRVQENSTLSGTGAITLAGATTPAMNTFASAFSDGALCGYIVLNLATPTEWEQGIGTYAAGTNTIARTYVLAASNGTSPVNFSDGAKMVLNASPPTSSGNAYSATQVYSPGDTAVLAGTTWYALAVNKGSTPAGGNPNWTAMGGSGGGGSGTVTSVGLTVPAWLAVSGSPITVAGTLAVSATPAQAAKQFLATPNATTGPVGLRAIMASDIPTLNQSTTGNAATATALATARTISGVSFNGTTNITIPFSGLGSKPTTLAGYGITDGLKTSNNLSDVANTQTAFTNLRTGFTNLGVYLNGIQSLSTAAFTPIVFDTKAYDAQNEYSTSTGIFTAAAAGTYFVSAGLYIGGVTAGTNEVISIFVNGVEQTRLFQIYIATSGTAMIGGSSILQLNAGDQVQINGFSSVTGGNVGGAAKDNYFRVIRVQ